MKLKTDIDIPISKNKINHFQKIYFMGSCFSEDIAYKFNYYGFNILSNSHGIIYNPVAINKCFSDIAIKQLYDTSNLFFNNGIYLSYAHHGCFSGSNPIQVIKNINETICTHHHFLTATHFVFITLGSSWVYTQNETEIIVANCHKIPSNNFKKRLLTGSEIDAALKEIIAKIHALNANTHIVFTLSPVKHLKDGFVENQLSKSLLHVAIQQVIAERVTYFPAYEIMNDDLRDYRFWKEDMVHPNSIAIEYIWERFCETYFMDDTLQLMKEVKKTRQFNAHKPLTDNRNEINKLNAEKQKRIDEMKAKYPQLIL